MFENGIVQTVGLTMTEILTLVKIFWPQGLRCQSVERPDDQNRVNLLRQVRNPARERSRNLNREVWESPSVYGGEDVNVAVEMLTGGVGIGFFLWDEWNRLNLSSVFLAVIVIGVTGLILDYLISRLQVLVTHRPAKPGS
jgi:hypothetical protein